MEPGNPCLIDAQEFERLCLEAEQSDDLPDEERLSLYEQAIALYMGDPVLGKANPSWAVLLASRYHNRYITSIKKYANLLTKQKDYSKMAEICLNALEAEPTNEELHILVIQSLMQQKSRRKH